MIAADTIVRFIVDTTPRAVLLVAVAAATTRLFRTRLDAATRNAIWTVALVGVLVLPLASIALPSWNPRLLPAPAADTPSYRPARTMLALAEAALVSGAPAAHRAPSLETEAPSIDHAGQAGHREVPWREIAALVWILGVACVLGTELRRLASIRRIRSSGPPHSRLQRLLEEERRRAGVHLPVRLCVNDHSIPMVWGLRPVISVPHGARDWSDGRARAVFRHELAHVRRGDWLTHLTARATCAVHWFNPFVWAAVREWRTTCEQACDESVVVAGTRASEYAEHLLQIAATVPVASRTPALPVVKTRNLEDRIMHILRSPRPVGRNALLAPALVLVIGLAIAATTPAPRAAKPRDTVPPSLESPPTLPSVAAIASPPTHPALPSPAHQFLVQAGIASGAGDGLIDVDLTDSRAGLRASIEGHVEIENGEIVHIGDDAEVFLTARRNDVRIRAFITSDGSGRPVVEWRVGGDERQVDDDAREWIRAALAIVEMRIEESSLSAHRDGLRAEIDGIHAGRDGLRAEADAERARLDQHRAEIDAIRARLDAREAERDGLYAVRNGLRAELHALEAARERLAWSLEELRDEDGGVDRIERVEAELEDIDQAMMQLEERIDAYGGDAEEDEARRHADELAAEAEIAAIQNRIDERNVDERLAEIEREIEGLEIDDHVRRLTEEIDSLELEERVGEIESALEDRYAEFERQTERVTKD